MEPCSAFPISNVFIAICLAALADGDVGLVGSGGREHVGHLGDEVDVGVVTKPRRRRRGGGSTPRARFVVLHDLSHPRHHWRRLCQLASRRARKWEGHRRRALRCEDHGLVVRPALGGGWFPRWRCCSRCPAESLGGEWEAVGGGGRCSWEFPRSDYNDFSASTIGLVWLIGTAPATPTMGLCRRRVGQHPIAVGEVVRPRELA